MKLIFITNRKYMFISELSFKFFATYKSGFEFPYTYKIGT